jgi:glutathione-regulated potassium-efflux system protein KefB
VIEANPDRIREAERFGFKVFYGDGTRLDILRASGAGEAQVIMICVDDRRAASAIVELARHEFPGATLLARSYDRGHSMELIRAGVDFEIRETLESALPDGGRGLRTLGCAEATVTEALEDIRRRDAQRLTEQVQGDIMSGRDKLLTAPSARTADARSHTRKETDMSKTILGLSGSLRRASFNAGLCGPRRSSRPRA